MGQETQWKWTSYKKDKKAGQKAKKEDHKDATYVDGQTTKRENAGNDKDQQEQEKDQWSGTKLQEREQEKDKEKDLKERDHSSTHKENAKDVEEKDIG